MLTYLHEKKQIQLTQLKLSENQIQLNAKGNFDIGENKKIALDLKLEKTQIQNLIQFIPKEFIPKIKDAQVEGSLSFKIKTEVDFKKPQNLVFEPEFDIENFKLVKAPKDVDIFKLKEEFVHPIIEDGEVIKTVTLGKSNRSFIPYTSLGRNATRGVLTCEDGSFFRHGGYQLKHIKASIIQNLKEKRFVRGASTISMQLAKNLFLSRDKNISRKFQEVLIAYGLEQEIDKKRLFEIYMNIIEWGPKIYGISHASRHYFHKHPSRLKPAEAAFLGSIISNPKKYYYMYRRGAVTDYWKNYLNVIVNKMHVTEESEDREVIFGWVAKKREKEEKLEAKKRKEMEESQADQISQENSAHL